MLKLDICSASWDFSRGRCKTQHNTYPLTVQYYTTRENSYKVGSTQFLTSIFLLYFFFYKPCKSSHGLFSKTNASTFFPSSLATTLQKQTWRVTYGGKTSLAKDIVQKAVSNKKSPNWSKNNENTYKQPWNYIVKSSIYKHN